MRANTDRLFSLFNIFLCVLQLTIFTTGCSSIGHNVGVAINDKRLIRNFYAVEEPTNNYYLGNDIPWYFIYGAESKDDADRIARKEERICSDDHYLSPEEKTEKQEAIKANLKYCDRYPAYKKAISEYEQRRAKNEHRKIEREFALISNKISNYPYAVTDPYDIRAREPIRAGEPLSIIINKVHLNDNRENFFYEFDHAEIAVVVSINDGSESNKNVLVAYETDINDGVDLPISDLLAFYTDSYQDTPIRISVTVFEFDQYENQLLNGLLSSAVSTAAAKNPALAIPGSLAEQLGSYLISSNSDDVITKFTFQVYPWKENQILNKSLGIGVPVVAHGQTVIFNTDNGSELIDRKLIHMTYGLDIVEYSKDDISNQIVLNLEEKIRTEEKDGLKQFPSKLDPSVQNFTATPTPRTHLVLTIDKRYMNRAAEVIKLANEIAQKASGFDVNSLDKDKAQSLQNSLDNLKQLDRLISQFKIYTEKGYSISAYIELVQNLKCTNFEDDSQIENCTPVLDSNLSKLSGRLARYFASITQPGSQSCRNDALSKECIQYLKSNLGSMAYDKAEGVYTVQESS